MRLSQQIVAVVTDVIVRIRLHLGCARFDRFLYRFIIALYFRHNITVDPVGPYILLSRASTRRTPRSNYVYR